MMPLKSTVNIGLDLNFPVEIKITNGPKSLYMDITKRAACSLMPLLIKKQLHYSSQVAWWTGPTRQGTNVRFWWLPSDFVGVTLFYDGVLTQNFNMTPDEARSLSQVIQASLYITGKQQIKHEEEPIVVIPEVVVDLLVGPKKRMDDNLNSVFGYNK
jgi:hypothetical protein